MPSGRHLPPAFGSAQPLVPPPVGWLCTYVPEELLLAAGMQPRRLAGDFAREDRVKAAYASTVCPYLRGALGVCLGADSSRMPERIGAAGSAGIVLANACDGMRRLADVWAHLFPRSFVHLLDVPRHTDESAVRYFAACLRGLRRRLEEQMERPISDDDLWGAIGLQNRVRRSLTQLADLRRRGDVPLSARRFYDLVWRSAQELRAPFAAWLEGELTGDDLTPLPPCILFLYLVLVGCK